MILYSGRVPNYSLCVAVCRHVRLIDRTTKSNARLASALARTLNVVGSKWGVGVRKGVLPRLEAPCSEIFLFLAGGENEVFWCNDGTILSKWVGFSGGGADEPSVEITFWSAEFATDHDLRIIGESYSTTGRHNALY